MNKIQKFRYDPLYRVIDETEEMNIVEGNFKILFDRLKKINNLGILPEIFKMAKYSKYEHGLGTIYQINSLLEIVDGNTIPDKYKRPLKLASLFLHLGHLPFTYSTERSLFLACNLGDRKEDNEIKKHIIKKLKKIIEIENKADEITNEIYKNIFSFRDYKLLYKYLSGYIIFENWGKLKTKFGGLNDEDLKLIIRDIVDKECDGYRFLNIADKVDYVQRDALYFGTVKIDVSPKHLYSDISKYKPSFSVSEEKLIDANLNYLNERFYNNSEVVWFSRLYEKILASLIISDYFKLDWLAKYNDDEFKRLITDNLDKDNSKTKLPPSWTKKAKELFNNDISYSLIFYLEGIIYRNEKDAIDIEYELIQKRESDRGLLTYPFEKGILIAIDYLDEDKYSYPIHQHYNVYSISVFQDNSKKRLLELLKVIKNLSYNLPINHVESCRESLSKEFSWTKEVDFKNKPVIDAISNAILLVEDSESKKGDFIEKFLKSISGILTFKELWNNFQNQYLWKGIIHRFLKGNKDQFEELEVYQAFTEGLLSLPIQLLQYNTNKKYLDIIYDKLEEIIPLDDYKDKKGHYFEALCLIDNMRTKKGTFQFFINGMVVIDPEKSKDQQEDNEFDIIELYINDSGKAECWIYACSISDNYEQKNREQIIKLTEYIHKRFPELIIRSRYVIPENKNSNQFKPKMENTGKNY